MSGIITTFGTDFTDLIEFIKLENEEMPFSVEIALKMIPEFNGDRNQLHRFITCCDIVGASVTSQVQTAQFLNVIKCKLTGTAYNVIKYRDFLDWASLKLELQNQYLERRTIAQLQRELLGNRQQPNEDIRTFANRLERLTADLNDACIASEGEEATHVIQNLNNKSCLKAFQEGLLEPVKIIIKASRFTTFNEAVESAVEEERIINQNKLFSKFQTKNDKKIIKCFKCNKLGHIAENCRSNFTTSLPSYPRRDEIKQEMPRKINIICAYCKKPGHHISTCYRKPNQSNKNKPWQASSSNTNVRNVPSTSKQNVRQINIIESGNESGPVASRGCVQANEM